MAWMLAFACIVGWLFAFDREIFELSYCLLTLSAASVYFCLAVSYRAINEEAAYLKAKHKGGLTET